MTMRHDRDPPAPHPRDREPRDREPRDWGTREWDPREFAAPMSRPEPAPASILTVSELVLRASNALEAEFGTAAVEGEISSLKRAGSGHLYWTLKDPSSAVECVMYRSDNQRLRIELAVGVLVVVVARPTYFL